MHPLPRDFSYTPDIPSTPGLRPAVPPTLVPWTFARDWSACGARARHLLRFRKYVAPVARAVVTAVVTGGDHAGGSVSREPFPVISCRRVRNCFESAGRRHPERVIHPHALYSDDPSLIPTPSAPATPSLRPRPCNYFTFATIIVTSSVRLGHADELAQFPEDVSGRRLRRWRRPARKASIRRWPAERLLVEVHRVGQAVGVEQQQVALLQVDDRLLVRLVRR